MRLAFFAAAAATFAPSHSRIDQTLARASCWFHVVTHLKKVYGLIQRSCVGSG